MGQLKSDVTLDLSWLVDPVSSEKFLLDHFGSAPLRLTRSQPHYYAGLVSRANLETAIYSAARVPGALEELAGDQKSRRLRNYSEACESVANGKSVRLDGIHRFSRQLAVFCRALEQRFSCPVNVNMYLTPGLGRALPRHYDTHDVFVLQLQGQKRWRLFDSPVRDPLEYLPPLRSEREDRMHRYRVQKRRDLSAQDTCLVKDEFVLSSGDLLYLPRGEWHEAAGVGGDHSCHLTIGVQAFTYVDLLTVAVGQAGFLDPALRQALPAGFGTNEDSRAFVRDHLSQVMLRLTSLVNIDAALGEVAEVFARSRLAVGETLSQAPTPPEQVDLDTMVQMRPGIVCGISRGEMEISLFFGSTTMTMPNVFESACSVVLQGTPFRPSSLPGDITNEERLSLVRRLISDGLLVKQRAKDDGPLISEGNRAGSRGWLPVATSHKDGKQHVRWLYFGDTTISEPFFAQTVARLSDPTRPAKKRTTGLGALLSAPEELPLAGLICHVSRCGSTLVSNALRVVPGTVVVSEAGLISSLLAGSAGPDGAQVNGRDILKAAVRALGQRRNASESALVIKLSSWNTTFLPLLRSLWPNVPILGIIRNPIEVIVSCLDRPPGWLRLRANSKSAGELFGWEEEDLGTMSEIDYCARGVGSFLSAMSKCPGEPVSIVDYSTLTPAAIPRIADSFGLRTSETAGSDLDVVFAADSKDPRGSRLFVDDRHQKQMAASNDVRVASAKWADDVYRSLLLQASRATVDV
jgi:ribosomal protein L16 Arg81 hydroxylase